MEGFFEIFTWFHKGGLVMYPLLACSILIIAIAVERFYFFKKNCLHQNLLIKGVDAKIQAGCWQEAAEQCQRLGGVVGRILEQGFFYSPDSVKMQVVFEESTVLEAANLKKNLQYLSTVVTLAPLLGLLGTVVGMIGSFRVFDVAEKGTAAITGGVGEALIATATGLCVAVLALVVHSYFSHRLDNLLTDIENICTTALRCARREKA